jgi:MoxR-like ATPase
MRYEDIQPLGLRIQENISRVLVGGKEAAELLITAVLAGGHALMEDVPGTGKTTLAKAFARSVSGRFERIQFTPDLLPSDVTGTRVWQQEEGRFAFMQGPVFCNILLADEINRATPRTQSAMLECMAEEQVTEGGQSHPLPTPFLVIATQNPVETQGTFPLPEAQLDRFLLRLSLGYPDHAQSVTVLDNYLSGKGSDRMELSPVATGAQIAEAQEAVAQVRIDPVVVDYIVRLAEATRAHEDVALGVSTRGMLSMTRCCQAIAAIEGRDYVLPDDVKRLAEPVFAHRMILKTRYGSSQKSAEILDRILTSVAAPTEDPAAKLPTE